MSQLTKYALMESFVKLLNQNSLDKIKVKDITNDCGVNRNTFYYHFKDIYNLMEEIFNLEVQKVVMDNIKYGTWQEGFLQSTKFAQENKKAIYHIYNSVSREQLEWYLYEVTDNIMFGFVEQQAEGMNVSKDDMHFIADFYKYALVGLALEWIHKGMKDDAKLIIQKMGQLFDGNIKHALNNCNRRKIETEN